jgi:hypothetical protein
MASRSKRDELVHDGLEGSTPSPSAARTWGHGPTGRHWFRNPEIRVRLPMTPLSSMPSWSSSECSPACHAGDREFKSRRGRSMTWRGTQTGKAAKLRPSCMRVRIPPSLLDDVRRPGSGDPSPVPGRPLTIRKVVGYGWPSRFATPCPVTGMWVQIPCLPLGVPNHVCPDGEMEIMTRF